jgi:hypothetical protein
MKNLTHYVTSAIAALGLVTATNAQISDIKAELGVGSADNPTILSYHTGKPSAALIQVPREMGVTQMRTVAQHSYKTAPNATASISVFQTGVEGKARLVGFDTPTLDEVAVAHDKTLIEMSKSLGFSDNVIESVMPSTRLLYGSAPGLANHIVYSSHTGQSGTYGKVFVNDMAQSINRVSVRTQEPATLTLTMDAGKYVINFAGTNMGAVGIKNASNSQDTSMGPFQPGSVVGGDLQGSLTIDASLRNALTAVAAFPRANDEMAYQIELKKKQELQIEFVPSESKGTKGTSLTEIIRID